MFDATSLEPCRYVTVHAIAYWSILQYHSQMSATTWKMIVLTLVGALLVDVAAEEMAFAYTGKYQYWVSKK